jgi:hypothetical protein
MVHDAVAIGKLNSIKPRVNVRGKLSQHYPPKRRYLYAKTQGFMHQNIEVFITTAVRTSN